VIVNDKIRVSATKCGDFSSFPPFFKSPGAGGAGITVSKGINMAEVVERRTGGMPVTLALGK